MKINDSERREIAARLRESREFISCLPKTAPEQNAFDTFELILACIGYEQGNLFDRLAELIDRPTCENVTVLGSHKVTVSDTSRDVCFDFVCGRCGIHLMGDEMDCSPLLDEKLRCCALHYCPVCGAEVVDDDD